ncbi:Binding-protein-dependent transport systems inner membrane component [Paracholeplasma brassicae]|uniref:Binding-protein-dependent transport systems inner membrane component n=1 Tax=Acholeplasma brassicae TaxID=61635 RepID=U4KNC0_9MOLU|nr:sugar ABC transporter permease [Paracholeplasma brassicae]CCV65822.1 Binding-protein-dependent transport systems inner membrane component [Paracholeplasma brassicae]
MTKVMTKVKGAILAPFKKSVEVVARFSGKHISPIFEKLAYLLTHNFIYRNKESNVVLFSIIKIKVTRRRREHFYGYMFISLWIIGFLIFTLYPMFNSLYLSFTESYPHLTRGMSTTFVGVRNYINIIRSQNLIPEFQKYIGKMLLSIPLIIVFSIMISMLINQPMKLKGIWRTIFFMPVIISSGPVILELTQQDAVSLPSISESGAIGFIVNNLGSWIANPLEALFNSLLLILWYAGVPILIFLAGLQKIDTSIYEAASIDGASPWDNFWKITLPSIKPLISVAIIYVVVSMSLYVEPGGVLDQAKMHMLNGGSDSALYFGYGYAAAISWVYFILMLALMGIFIGVTSIRRKKVKRWN